MKSMQWFKTCCFGLLFFICSSAYAQSQGPFRTVQDLLNAYANSAAEWIYLDGVGIRDGDYFGPIALAYYVRCNNGWLFYGSCQSPNDAFTTRQSLLDYFGNGLRPGTAFLDGQKLNSDFSPTIYYYYKTCKIGYIVPTNRSC